MVGLVQQAGVACDKTLYCKRRANACIGALAKSKNVVMKQLTSNGEQLGAGRRKPLKELSAHLQGSDGAVLKHEAMRDGGWLGSAR